MTTGPAHVHEVPSPLVGPGVSVQLLRIGTVDGTLRWSSTCVDLSGGQTPDALARVMADLPREAGQDGIALHSTSWRFAHGRVVLTYAIFPASGAQPTWPELGEHVAISEGPVDPSPQQVGDADVAAHAARHLADLAGGRDPHLVACSQRQPSAWQGLLRHAGRVHAHAAPERSAHPTDPWRGPAGRDAGNDRAASV